jgi:mRNA interferase HigB
MKLVRRDILDALSRKHADLRSTIASWIQEVERALWKTPQDIKDRYSSATFLAGNSVIFNIKGNSYRLEVLVAYETGVVMVKWAGRHAEYSNR